MVVCGGGMVDIVGRGSDANADEGVGVGASSLSIDATVRLGAGSVYFVRFGNGEDGRLGASCSGCGV